MKLYLLIALSFFFNLVIGSEMSRINITFEDEQRHYLVYVPDHLKNNKTKNLVIGIHGYTGSASGFEKETTGGFNKSANKYNFIAVYPQGSVFYEKKFSKGVVTKNYVSSWNDLTASKTQTPNGETCAVDAVVYPKYPNCLGKDAGRCAWSSCGNDIGFIKKVIDDVSSQYAINNIYILGMSNGGKIAHALACQFPDLFSGVINVAGSPQLGLGCKPKGPINYIIYAGLKDYVVPPFDIVSFDKYFYTPIDEIVADWKVQFECSSTKLVTYNEFDNIEEEIHSDCINDVKIIRILNKDRGHTWPGITSTSAGYCSSSDQDDLEIDECDNNINTWGNDYLLEKLFSFD